MSFDRAERAPRCVGPVLPVPALGVHARSSAGAARIGTNWVLADRGCRMQPSDGGGKQRRWRRREVARRIEAVVPIRAAAPAFCPERDASSGPTLPSRDHPLPPRTEAARSRPAVQTQHLHHHQLPCASPGGLATGDKVRWGLAASGRSARRAGDTRRARRSASRSPEERAAPERPRTRTICPATLAPRLRAARRRARVPLHAAALARWGRGRAACGTAMSRSGPCEAPARDQRAQHARGGPPPPFPAPGRAPTAPRPRCPQMATSMMVQAGSNKWETVKSVKDEKRKKAVEKEKEKKAVAAAGGKKDRLGVSMPEAARGVFADFDRAFSSRPSKASARLPPAPPLGPPVCCALTRRRRRRRRRRAGGAQAGGAAVRLRRHLRRPGAGGELAGGFARHAAGRRQGRRGHAARQRGRRPLARARQAQGAPQAARHRGLRRAG
jgi:hypothetical protein